MMIFVNTEVAKMKAIDPITDQRQNTKYKQHG